MEDEDKYSKIYQVGYPNRLPRYTVPVELPPEPLILSENNQRVYHSVVELYMSQYYNTLSEKDRRCYTAIESLKLGHWGITYISCFLGCSHPTIRKGIKEIKNLLRDDDGRIRKPGGGRKPYYETYPDIDEKFLDILKEYTTGDPMDEKVIWTNLKQQGIADLLSEKQGIKVSRAVIRQLLEKHGYRKRKAQKSKTMKYVKNRDEQFKNIAKYISIYKASGNPIISMDTKKKEFLGDFYRDGYLYCWKKIMVWDHDFNTFARGVVIPHGIYDMLLKKGYINIGTSKDTGEFACDSIRNWWYNYGQHNYPNAT